jgi:hypothetical protein
MKKEPVNNLIAGIIFAVFTGIMTYPLIFRLNKAIPGFFSTDESYGVLWGAWLFKHSFFHHLSIAHTNYVAYPFGLEFFGHSVVGYLWFSMIYILGVLTTPVLTYNLQVLFNFTLCAFFTYLLALYFTKDRFSAFFSGIIFGFCPYMFMRSWQHLGETYLWPIPLFVLFLFRLRDESGLRIKIMFVLSFILTTFNF